MYLYIHLCLTDFENQIVSFDNVHLVIVQIVNNFTYSFGHVTKLMHTLLRRKENLIWELSDWEKLYNTPRKTQYTLL